MISPSRPSRQAKAKALPLDTLIFSRSFLFFIFFFGLTLWAFWTSYYGIIHTDMPSSIRFHGTAMTLWCLMLIVQPLLILLKKNSFHRLTGKISYVLVPFILWSGANLAAITIRQSGSGSDSYYFQIALMFNSLVVFAILYGLAIWHRKNPALHARYMVCTIFPLITPVTDRLIYKYFQDLIPLAPLMRDGSPMVPALGFAVGDIILCILLIWDWKINKRLHVFSLVLGLLLLYHLSVLTFYKYGFWREIGNFIMG